MTSFQEIIVGDDEKLLEPLSFDKGIEWTAKMIKYCHSLNPELEYEVGTEESIRKFEVEELDMFLFTLKKLLTTQQFNKIKYLVIQSGTSLEENKNTGEYDKQRLKSMIKVVKKYNLLSKEHVLNLNLN